MLKVADLERLSACMKKTPPTRKQVKELTVRVEAATKLNSLLRAFEDERKAVQHVAEVIESLSVRDQFGTLPNYPEVIRLTTALNTLNFKLQNSIAHLGTNFEVISYKRCQAWSKQLAEPWMEDMFVVQEGLDRQGKWAHQIKGRYEPFKYAENEIGGKDEHWTTMMRWVPREGNYSSWPTEPEVEEMFNSFPINQLI